jgi:hypothetical protein
MSFSLNTGTSLDDLKQLQLSKVPDECLHHVMQLVGTAIARSAAAAVAAVATTSTPRDATTTAAHDASPTTTRRVGLAQDSSSTVPVVCIASSPETAKLEAVCRDLVACLLKQLQASKVPYECLHNVMHFVGMAISRTAAAAAATGSTPKDATARAVKYASPTISTNSAADSTGVHGQESSSTTPLAIASSSPVAPSSKRSWYKERDSTAKEL